MLKGLFGGPKMRPEERSALENYLAVADPLLQALDAAYDQWLERVGITKTTDLRAINDPKGEHSGVFVWHTIETERSFLEIRPPERARRLQDALAQCIERRHEAASTLYDALQIAEARTPKAALEAAAETLTAAAKLRQQAETYRREIDKVLS